MSNVEVMYSGYFIKMTEPSDSILHNSAVRYSLFLGSKIVTIQQSGARCRVSAKNDTENQISPQWDFLKSWGQMKAIAIVYNRLSFELISFHALWSSLNTSVPLKKVQKLT